MSEPKVKHSVEAVDRKDEPVLYKLMDELVGAHHPDLTGARIVIAVERGVKPDQDGHVRLGSMQRPSEVNRQLHAFDFILTLNADALARPDFTPEMRRALVDHELCHATVTETEEGTKTDDAGNPVYRIRQHDVQEFEEVVRRHRGGERPDCATVGQGG
jgi:hypothetical protein